MGRRPDYRTLYCELTAEERQWLTTLKHRVGIRSDANLVREALFNLATDAGLDPPRDIFATRRAGRPRTTPTRAPATVPETPETDR
jgi:hypothetical protein